ncbi:MAG: HNH endonuclease, partial [Eubacteriales bacterium]|nr:HNH endonuclease [Eubacteriales bacterium]
KEVAEAGAEKAAKEAAEAGTEKTVKEVAETGVEKTVKEASENENVIIRYMECRNQGLEGKVHPETGVEFVRKTVDDGTGNFVEGVFPKFDSAFDAKLPEEMFDKSNFTQFKEANRQLVEKTEKDPSLLKFFTDEQFEQIVDGIKTGVAPDGFVWHHNEETGVLQLVDDLVHSITGHTGGRAIWGGGY